MVVTEITNRNNIGKNKYSGVLGIADYESVVSFSKFKIDDSIWRHLSLRIPINKNP